MYASGRLQGTTSAWWDAYIAAHATPDAITWQEFTTSFRSYHIPASLMKLKKKEFLPLKQGEMSVIEYRDKFVELSRYAPEDVADDEKKQELFMEGLAEPLQYQLIPHTFPSFQMLLYKAIGLEYKRKELEELKRKATTFGQSGSNNRPRFTPPQGHHIILEAQVRTLGSSSFSVPYNRLHGPVLDRIVRWRQLSPQWILAPLEVPLALSVERLDIMQMPAPKGMLPTLQYRVSIASK
jgi:hypothetical protein